MVAWKRLEVLALHMNTHPFIRRTSRTLVTLALGLSALLSMKAKAATLHTGDLLAADAGASAIVQVAVGTGDRSIVTGVGVGSGVTIQKPCSVTHTPNGSVFYLEVGASATKGIVSVALADGVRTLISGGIEGSGPAFVNPGNLCWDRNSNTLLVVDLGTSSSNCGILRVNPVTGARVLVTGNGAGSGAAISAPKFVTCAPNGMIYYFETLGVNTNRIMSCDPVTGFRAAVSGGAGIGVIGTGLTFSNVTSLCWDPSTNSLVVGDSGALNIVAAGIIRVNVATGARVFITGGLLNLGDGPLLSAPRCVIGSALGTVYCIESSLLGGVENLLKVTTGGLRDIVSGLLGGVLTGVGDGLSDILGIAFVETEGKPVIGGAVTANASYGQFFSYQIQATGTPNGYGCGGTLPDNVSLDSGTGVISGTPTSIGTYNVTVSATNGTGTGTQDLQIVVGQGSITINGLSVQPKSYDGTQVANLITTGVSLDGVVGNDVLGLNFSGATATYASKDAGTGIAITVSGVTLTGAAAGKYALPQPSLAGDIAAAQIGVTVNASQTKNQNQPDPAFTYSVTTGALANGENFTGALARAVGEAPGTYAISQGTLALSSNYVLNVTGALFTIIDNIAPYVVSVQTPGAGTYALGSTLEFIVTFSEPVTVDGLPKIPLQIGGTLTSADYVSGNGTTTLVFRHTITSTDIDGDGIVAGPNVNLNGGSIVDAAVNALDTALHGVGNTTGILVDGVVPAISGGTAPLAGIYKAGQNIDFTVTFSKPVIVDTTNGTPALAITLGSGIVAAPLFGGSGTSTLTFRYTVQTGDSDPDGIAVGGAIVLNNGTIKDGAGNGAGLGVSYNTSGVKVDGLAPAVGSLVRQNPVTSSTSLTSVTFRVTFAETVTGVDAGDFSLATTNTAVGTIGTLTPVSGSTYDVAVTGVTGTGTLRLDLKGSGTGIADTAGNPVDGGYSAGEAYTLVANRAPSFTSGGDVSASQSGGAQTIAGWAKNISAGAPDEAGQVLTFNVVAQDPSLFTVAPAISADGTLTFTPKATASASTTVTVTLHDDGGTNGGGEDTSAPVTFHLAVTTYLEELGTYDGLVQADTGVTPTNDTTGLAKVVIGKKGAFTATIRVGSTVYRTSGTFDKAGAVHFGKGVGKPTLTLKRSKKSSLTLTLKLDVGNGTDKLAGTITDGSAPFAVIDANRRLYTSKKNPVAPFRNVDPSLLGKYTVAFVAKTPADQGLAADQYPQGHGCGILTVSKSGLARFTGYLADGSKISVANALSKLNHLPFFASLSGGKGSISGVTLFEDRVGISDFDSLNMRWFKPANSKATYYPQGWASGIKTDLIGSKFVLPAVTNPPTSVLTGLAATDADGNAQVEFADGNLGAQGLTKPLNINGLNVATVAGANAEIVNVILAATMKQVGSYENNGIDYALMIPDNQLGQICGSFVHPGSQLAVGIRGVVFQKQKIGLGYFLGQNQSGSLTVTPK